MFSLIYIQSYLIYIQSCCISYSNVSVVTFSLSVPVCITKIFEKYQASEMMSDRYGHKILNGEFRFCGSYLSKIEKNFSEVV